MKKWIALLLVLVMVLSMAACGKDDIRGTQVENKNETPEEKKPGFSLGQVSGLTYENPFIGIGCKLNNEWSFYDDAQIREMNNATADLAGEAYQEAMKNATVVYDMYAVHEGGINNIIVNLEKVNALQLATADLAAVFESQMPTIKVSLENMGYTNVTFELAKITIGGKAFDGMYTTSDLGEYRMYQATIMIKCDGYLSSVSITTFDKAELDSLLKCFYLL